MHALVVLALILVAAGAVSRQALAEATLEDFFGFYVGAGVAERDDGSTEQRDMDVAIQPFKRDGFTLNWITVIYDGDDGRTSADVKRRQVEEDFVPSPDQPGVYISAPEGGLFSQAELPNPLAGDPFRWASLNGDTLTVYSAGIQKDGATEMQIYHRTLTEDGLDVSFVRLENEHVRVRVEGALRRSE